MIEKVNKLLGKIYGAYSKKDCILMKNYLDELREILKKDENKLKGYKFYLEKYEGLYNNVCGGVKSEEKKTRIIKYKGKTIRCPHCGAPLTESEYNKKVIEDYKSGKIKELKFKCAYCGTEFVWDYNGIKPLFLKDIRIGGEYEIDGKKYRVSGVVKYSGTWYEDGDSGTLIYNEYIMYDSNGDICRLSESISYWGGEKENEIEISKKVDFPYVIEDITEKYIKIDGKRVDFKEKDKVVVEKVYGEVGKGYKVGEIVSQYVFDYKGKEYVLEKEESGSNKEANIYEIVYHKQVNGDIDGINLKNNLFRTNKREDNDVLSYLGFLLFIGVILKCVECVVILLFFMFLIIIIGNDVIKHIGVWIFKKFMLYIFVLVFVIFGWIMAGKRIFYDNFAINISRYNSFNEDLKNVLENVKKGYYQFYFSGNRPYIRRLTYTYDAGGKEYKYTYYNGFTFKIKTEKDKEYLEYFIKNFVNKDNIWLPLDKKGEVIVNLKDYKGNLILRKVKYHNYLGF